MKFTTQFIILLYSLFFLFYPGDSYYVKLFSYNRELFADETSVFDWKVDQVPVAVNQSVLSEISAGSIYIVDEESFTPVLEKNADGRFSPASTAKIITALVAFDYYKLDEILRVKRTITERQVVGLIEGEKITVENLLYGILVHSGNDAAFVLADNYPRGEPGFIAAMNAKAKALHMNNSYFKNPAGFDEFGQHTTAFDLALAGRVLLQNKTLAKMVSTKSIAISDVDFTRFHYLANVNKLLGEIQGIGGLKTGYTLDAGENLVTFYKKNGHQYLIVILKSEDRFEDTKKIVEWINTKVAYTTP